MELIKAGDTEPLLVLFGIARAEMPNVCLYSRSRSARNEQVGSELRRNRFISREAASDPATEALSSPKATFISAFPIIDNISRINGFLEMGHLTTQSGGYRLGRWPSSLHSLGEIAFYSYSIDPLQKSRIRFAI